MVVPSILPSRHHAPERQLLPSHPDAQRPSVGTASPCHAALAAHTTAAARAAPVSSSHAAVAAGAAGVPGGIAPVGATGDPTAAARTATVSLRLRL